MTKEEEPRLAQCEHKPVNSLLPVDILSHVCYDCDSQAPHPDAIKQADLLFAARCDKYSSLDPVRRKAPGSLPGEDDGTCELRCTLQTERERDEVLSQKSLTDSSCTESAKGVQSAFSSPPGTSTSPAAGSHHLGLQFKAFQLSFPC